MTRNTLRRFLLLLATLAAGAYVLPAHTDSAPNAATPENTGRYLFQVVLHTPAEIEKLLARAEQLAATQRPSDRRAGIALVLHGPEVELFARRNYAKYRQLVDRAAKLDADGVIEVKMCQTEMRSRGIREQDVPGFIELVPYGPDEEERLKRRGYVYL